VDLELSVQLRREGFAVKLEGRIRHRRIVIAPGYEIAKTATGNLAIGN
jgi:hypothetical protein